MDARILGAARHNVITTPDLRALGLSDVAIAYRVRAGRLHRKYREVFAVGRPDLSLDGLLLAATLACGPRAVLSHRSALRKWRLAGGGTYRIDISAPRSIKPKPGIRLHRPRCLDDLDVTELDGIPITSVAQTLLDMADPAYGRDVGALIHAAIVEEVIDAREVWALLARSPGARGARRLDAAMREEHPFTRSGLERAALALFDRAAIPRPRTNAHVWDGEKLVEVDFLWRELGLIVEVDGSRYHRSRWRRRRDAAKTAALEAQGWIVQRFTDADVAGRPDWIAATVLTVTSGPRDFG